MTITLTPDQEAIINRKLAEDDFTDADKGNESQADERL